MRPLRYTPIWISLLLAALCLPATPTYADDGRPPIHVQIVLDSSGSMKNNDPRRLSLLAGMMFTDLAGPNDWVGVLSMKEGRFVEERISAIGDRRDRVRESVHNVRFRGATFCAEPLEQAAKGLDDLRQKQPNVRQFVIFLSDGACSDDVRSASAKLSTGGVKVFSIGLFGPISGDSEFEGDPTAALKTMASVTGGEFFRAKKAADLPERFASILGRIVGSEAQQVELRPGVDATAELDGYVYDASFIATGSGEPIVVDAAAGPDQRLDLPHRTRHSTKGDGFYVAAHGNGNRRFYSVLRIDEPPAGRWTFRVDGPPNVQGLLIQNYALDPVVELGETRRVYALGESIDANAWLRGKDGERIEDPNFLQKVAFTLYFTDPKGREHELELKPGDDGVFTAKKELDSAGGWAVRGRARMKSGGLNKATGSARFEVRAAQLALAEGHEPIDLGELKAGATSDGHTVDFGASELPAAYEVTAKLSGLDQFELQPTGFELGPDSTTADLTFTVSAEHPGGDVDGHVVFDMQGASVKLPVTATVVPLTFWERWGRLVIAIAVGIAGLLLLIFIVYGIVSPHDFPADARFNWGESMDRLKKNEIVIREIRGTGRGFYRNAKLEIGGDGFLPGGPVLAVIEMTGPTQMVIRSPNTQLEKVNKFDESKTKAVDGNETSLHSGEIYRVGEIYLRLR